MPLKTLSFECMILWEKKKILFPWSFLNATVKQWTIQKEKGSDTDSLYLKEMPNVYLFSL